MTDKEPSDTTKKDLLYKQVIKPALIRYCSGNPLAKIAQLDDETRNLPYIVNLERAAVSLVEVLSQPEWTLFSNFPHTSPPWIHALLTKPTGVGVVSIMKVLNDTKQLRELYMAKPDGTEPAVFKSLKLQKIAVEAILTFVSFAFYIAFGKTWIDDASGLSQLLRDAYTKERVCVASLLDDGDIKRQLLFRGIGFYCESDITNTTFTWKYYVSRIENVYSTLSGGIEAIPIMSKSAQIKTGPSDTGTEEFYHGPSDGSTFVYRYKHFDIPNSWNKSLKPEAGQKYRQFESVMLEDANFLKLDNLRTFSTAFAMYNENYGITEGDSVSITESSKYKVDIWFNGLRVDKMSRIIKAGPTELDKAANILKSFNATHLKLAPNEEMQIKMVQMKDATSEKTIINPAEFYYFTNGSTTPIRSIARIDRVGILKFGQFSMINSNPAELLVTFDMPSPQSSLYPAKSASSAVSTASAEQLNEEADQKRAQAVIEEKRKEEEARLEKEKRDLEFLAHLGKEAEKIRVREEEARTQKRKEEEKKELIQKEKELKKHQRAIAKRLKLGEEEQENETNIQEEEEEDKEKKEKDRRRKRKSQAKKRKTQQQEEEEKARALEEIRLRIKRPGVEQENEESDTKLKQLQEDNKKLAIELENLKQTSNYNQIRANTCVSKQDELKIELQSLRRELNQTNARHLAQLNKLTLAKNLGKNVDVEAVKARQETLEGLEVDIQINSELLDTLSVEIQASENDVARLNDELQQKKGELEGLSIIEGQKYATMAVYDKQLEKLEGIIAKKKTAPEILSETNAELKFVQDQIADSRRVFAELESTKFNLNQELDKIRTRAMQEQELSTSASTSFTTYSERIEQQKKMIKEDEQIREVLRQEISQLMKKKLALTSTKAGATPAGTVGGDIPSSTADTSERISQLEDVITSLTNDNIKCENMLAAALEKTDYPEKVKARLERMKQSWIKISKPQENIIASTDFKNLDNRMFMFAFYKDIKEQPIAFTTGQTARFSLGIQREAKEGRTTAVIRTFITFTQRASTLMSNSAESLAKQKLFWKHLVNIGEVTEYFRAFQNIGYVNDKLKDLNYFNEYPTLFIGSSPIYSKDGTDQEEGGVKIRTKVTNNLLKRGLIRMEEPSTGLILEEENLINESDVNDDSALESFSYDKDVIAYPLTQAEESDSNIIDGFSPSDHLVIHQGHRDVSATKTTDGRIYVRFDMTDDKSMYMKFNDDGEGREFVEKEYDNINENSNLLTGPDRISEHGLSLLSEYTIRNILRQFDILGIYGSTYRITNESFVIIGPSDSQKSDNSFIPPMYIETQLSLVDERVTLPPSTDQ